MGAMKGNMAMMVPQTLIMGWINAFFAGFVIMKLPFPLTPQFKSMLQSGVGTRDLDVRWVSSLSWYFLTLFGLQPVYNFILGSSNGTCHVVKEMDLGILIYFLLTSRCKSNDSADAANESRCWHVRGRARCG